MSRKGHSQCDLLIYPTHLLSTIHSSHRPTSHQRPHTNENDGYVSAKGAKRLRRAINWLHAISPEQTVNHPETGKPFKFRLNFITLTLCSEQMHSDQEIKAKMLHPWITNICRKFKVKSYVWKAEPQANGNIHFHFVTNKFMHMHVIRRSWNACQNRMGYIAEYRKAQQAWHKNGFKPRAHLYPNWSKEKQLKAFEHGVKSNWSDPNSTDVHSLSNIKNAAAYIAKYMTKNFTATCVKCKHKTHHCEQPDKILECPKCSSAMEVTQARPIKGRVWYISQSLSQIKPLRVQLTGVIDAELYVANGWKSEGIELNPYATIYKIRPLDIPKYAGNTIKNTFINFCNSYYNLIENPSQWKQETPLSNSSAEAENVPRSLNLTAGKLGQQTGENERENAPPTYEQTSIKSPGSQSLSPPLASYGLQSPANLFHTVPETSTTQTDCQQKAQHPP